MKEQLKEVLKSIGLLLLVIFGVPLIIFIFKVLVYLLILLIR